MDLTLPATGLQFPDDIVFRGYASPVRIEADVHDLEVVGQIPVELNGAYFRNSADHCYPPLLGKDIFLNGDGMVHCVRFENGHADLKTRYVRTEKFKLERQARRALFGAYRNPFTDAPEVAGRDNNTANTSILWHHGRLYALKESGRPYELDANTLETLGERDFDGALESRTFTAHPKVDPETGECIAFGYNTKGTPDRWIEIYTIDPQGALVRTERFQAPYCSMVHDMLVSRNYIAFVVCPMTSDPQRIRLGKPYWHWDNTLDAHVAVIPRREGVSGIRWFRSPRRVFQTHTFNAWEDDGPNGTRLHLEHFITESGWLSQFPDLHDPAAEEKPPFGERWTLELGLPHDGFAVERFIAHIGEMPAIDTRHAMTRTRHFWFGTGNPELGPMLPPGPKGPPFTCLAHLDGHTGELDFWYAGADSSPEEPHFVPRGPHSPEGDGWLLSVVGRRAENRTDLVILDALRLSAGPVAVVKLPCRIHEGFHGQWVSARSLGW
jgi:carotenoid cleavage dioxygenase